ncbi:MAG: TetR/AcrR family transcriptional regulator, partial [Bacteroidota bacterium]
FEKYYRDTVSFFLENPLFFHFMEQLQASPIITQESKDRGYQAVNSVIDLLESGKEQRIIKDIPTRELMQFIGGTILSFLRHHLAEDRSLQPALTHQMRMVWDALKE